MEGKEREWGHQALEKFSCEEGERRKQLERSVESGEGGGVIVFNVRDLSLFKYQ